MKISRRKFIRELGATAAVASLTSLQACAKLQRKSSFVRKQPNLLFICVDEMRQMDMSCSDNPDIRTPNMDRLATEGAMLTRMFTPNPVCSPARSSMMTGLYPHNAGVYKNGLRMRNDVPCIAEILSDAGYKTGHIGKWHLDGQSQSKMYTFVPPERHRGFQYWAGFEHGHSYWDGCYYTDSAEPKHFPKGTYEPDGQTDLALNFIRQHRDTLWYLDLSWGPPHFPIEEAKPEDRERFDPKTFSLRPNVPPEFEEQARKDYVNYYAMIENLDWNLGRILQQLDELDLLDSTIVIFTSDHGDMLFSHGQHYKRRPNEESVRVPFLVRYPKGIAPGQTIQTLATLVDVVPTCLDMLGIDPIHTDGLSLAPVLFGQETSVNRDSVYMGCNQHGCRDYDPGLYSLSPWRAVRTDRYKASFLKENDGKMKMVAMFDLQSDPYEMNNLMGKNGHEKLQMEMTKRLHVWVKKTNDTLL